jgi:hypothetical protein
MRGRNARESGKRAVADEGEVTSFGGVIPGNDVPKGLLYTVASVRLPLLIVSAGRLYV